MENSVTPILIEPNQPNFVITPYVEDTINRALTYIGAGFPIHFMSPAGTGKTTLAMYVAAQIGRPVILIHGDEELGTRDLVGAEYGYRTKKVVDNFIHSVLKTEEKVAGTWVDNRLTVACKHGFTLIYDEFTRSRPEANNTLLAVLEEKILDLSVAPEEQGYLRVHPDFSAIFTSNPEEYAGVHRAQDALRDRMITIKLSHYDRETEIAITSAKSGLPHSEAERIVDIVRGFREAGGDGSTPTVRACIMIAKVLKLCEARPTATDKSFVQACVDILDSHSNAVSRGRVKQKEVEKTAMNLINKYC